MKWTKTKLEDWNEIWRKLIRRPILHFSFFLFFLLSHLRTGPTSFFFFFSFFFLLLILSSSAFFLLWHLLLFLLLFFLSSYSFSFQKKIISLSPLISLYQTSALFKSRKKKKFSLPSLHGSIHSLSHTFFLMAVASIPW